MRDVVCLRACTVLISFNLAYQSHIRYGGHFVVNKHVIVKNYINGWFIIDFVSILPLWVLTLQFDDPFGTANSTVVKEGGGAERAAVLTRLARLLRLLKLVRVTKALRVLERHVKDMLMHKFEMTYANLSVLKLGAMMCIFLHWQACAYGYAATLEEINWVGDFDLKHLVTTGKPATAFDRYIAALYFSGMTLTSIGYGEFLPVNTTERIFLIVLMVLSGFVWTFVIGKVSMVCTSLDPNTIAYQNDMDSLNFFMRDRQLNKELRLSLRDYFAQSREIRQRIQDQKLIEKMSPLLQNTVSFEANRVWLDQIWYLRNVENMYETGQSFLARLCKRIQVCGYVQKERLPLGQLYIIARGIVVKNWRFFGVGKVWGEDMLIKNPELVDHAQGVAVTYVEAYYLRKSDFVDTMSEYPELRLHIERLVRRIGIQRALSLKLFRLARGANVQIHSFIPRSQARGFEVVEDGLSMEQKVDVLVGAIVQPNTTPSQSPNGQRNTKRRSSLFKGGISIGLDDAERQELEANKRSNQQFLAWRQSIDGYDPSARPMSPLEC